MSKKGWNKIDSPIYGGTSWRLYLPLLHNTEVEHSIPIHKDIILDVESFIIRDDPWFSLTLQERKKEETLEKEEEGKEIRQQKQSSKNPYLFMVQYSIVFQSLRYDHLGSYVVYWNEKPKRIYLDKNIDYFSLVITHLDCFFSGHPTSLPFSSTFQPDYSICLYEEKIPCHKVVLASQSEVFKALLTNKIWEKDSFMMTPLTEQKETDLKIVHYFVSLMYDSKQIKVNLNGKEMCLLLLLCDQYMAHSIMECLVDHHVPIVMDNIIEAIQCFGKLSNTVIQTKLLTRLALQIQSQPASIIRELLSNSSSSSICCSSSSSSFLSSSSSSSSSLSSSSSSSSSLSNS